MQTLHKVHNIKSFCILQFINIKYNEILVTAECSNFNLFLNVLTVPYTLGTVAL